MIWPFNYTERKARKLAHTRVLLLGYKQQLKRLQDSINGGEAYSFRVLEAERDTVIKIGNLENTITRLSK